MNLQKYVRRYYAWSGFYITTNISSKWEVEAKWQDSKNLWESIEHLVANSITPEFPHKSNRGVI